MLLPDGPGGKRGARPRGAGRTGWSGVMVTVLLVRSSGMTVPMRRPRLSGRSLPMSFSFLSPKRWPRVNSRLNASSRSFSAVLSGVKLPAAAASSARRYVETTMATYSGDFIRPSIFSDATGAFASRECRGMCRGLLARGGIFPVTAPRLRRSAGRICRYRP